MNSTHEVCHAIPVRHGAASSNAYRAWEVIVKVLANAVMSLAMIAAFCLVFEQLSTAQSLDFYRQFGTENDELGANLAVDEAGNLYMVGWSDTLNKDGALDTDAFLTKFDSAGNVLWRRNFGTDETDRAWDVVIGQDNSIVVAGDTRGDLGGPNAGDLNHFDLFVRKYNSEGVELWTSQYGTDIFEFGTAGVSLDANGNIYTGGATSGTFEGNQNFGEQDAFVAKHDSNGNLVWIRQFGTTENEFRCRIAVGEDCVFITGSTQGEFGGPNQSSCCGDIFLAKFDSIGNQVWVRQTETANAVGGIAVDNMGRILLAGNTSATLNSDLIVARFGENGDLDWITQTSSNESATPMDLQVDELGDAYVTGFTFGSLGGGHAGGAWDIFAARIDEAGSINWLRQLGTSKNEIPFGMAVGMPGEVYITGYSTGGLFTDSAGGEDIFVAHYVNDPGPIVTTSEQFTIVRGIAFAGDVDDTFTSNDSYLKLNPGFVTSPTEAPVSLVFESNAGASVSDIAAQIESNAGTPGLTFFVAFWNWADERYDTVGVAAESFNTDFTANYQGNVNDHVNPKGTVRSRVEWRKTGFTLQFPWEVRIDQFVWNVSS